MKIRQLSRCLKKVKPTSMNALFSLILIFSFPVHAEEGTGGSLLNAENKSEKLKEEEQSILERHYPFYFAYGRPTSKLQLSFKSPLVRGVPLYFGYTQFMFWALEEKSKPFRDFTYNPELFYRLAINNKGYLKSIDFGGYGHNSNGKREEDSRSLDKHYLRMNFEREGPRWITRVGIQASYLYNFDDTNRDIQDYIGPLSLSVSFIQLFDSWVDKSEIALTASPGGKFATDLDHGGYQLSWSFRFGKFQLVPAFYMQYYYGYAETLLNYDQQVSEFRAGFVY
jgi:phospholipase A1